VSRNIALLLVLVFLTVSCLVTVKPAWSSINAAENSWVQKAHMHEARNNFGVAVVNGKIYVIGGDTFSGTWTYSMGLIDHTNGTIVGTNEEYDPATDTWTSKTFMPTPRTAFATAVYNDKIYCMGGGNSQANEVYDPATDTWETKAPIPATVFLVPANVINGKIYVIDYSGTNYVYDPLNDSWGTRTSTPMPSAAGFDGHVSAVVNGKLHIIGGLSSNQDSNLHQIYDPATDNWSYASSPPNSVGNANGNGAAASTTGEMALKRIYVLGQQGNLKQGEPQGSNRIYDPQTDSWVFGANLPTDRINFGIAVVNDILYVIGGGSADNWFIGNFGPSAVNEQYTPVGYGTPDPSYVLETTAPKISLLMPLNQSYNESSVPLVFSVDKLVNWTGYSLDGQDNVTVTGNTTLSGLSNGLHNVTVHAKDSFENIGASDTVWFRVAEAEPFPVVPVAVVSGASAIAIGVGLLVNFKKHKQNVPSSTISNNN
jgi:N-acetylneuraminic acid mutarotase